MVTGVCWSIPLHLLTDNYRYAGNGAVTGTRMTNYRVIVVQEGYRPGQHHFGNWHQIINQELEDSPCS